MARTIVLSNHQGDVVKKDGVCYEFIGYEPLPVTHSDADGSFDACDDCEQGSSGGGGGGGGGGPDCCSDPEQQAGAPKVTMTLSGINAGNRSGFDGGGDYFTWLNCQFYNNIPRDVCPTNYTCNGTATTGNDNEDWQMQLGNPPSPVYGKLELRASLTTFGGFDQVTFGLGPSYSPGGKNSTRAIFQKYTWSTPTPSTANMTSTAGVNPANFPLAGSLTTNLVTGNVQAASGITFAWARGPDGTVTNWGC